MDNRNGIGIAGILLIVFIVLKLCNIVTWSWVWVLSPLWISVILTITFYIIIYKFFNRR